MTYIKKCVCYWMNWLISLQHVRTCLIEYLEGIVNSVMLTVCTYACYFFLCS